MEGNQPITLVGQISDQVCTSSSHSRCVMSHDILTKGWMDGWMLIEAVNERNKHWFLEVVKCCHLVVEEQDGGKYVISKFLIFCNVLILFFFLSVK